MLIVARGCDSATFEIVGALWSGGNKGKPRMLMQVTATIHHRRAWAMQVTATIHHRGAWAMKTIDVRQTVIVTNVNRYRN